MHSVVWLGDSSVAMPSDADLRAINAVLAEQANHGQPTIVGHRDINATDCPGSNLTHAVGSYAVSSPFTYSVAAA
jgi:hypothetical protein